MLRRGFLQLLGVAPAALIAPSEAKVPAAKESFDKLAASLTIDEQMGVVMPSSEPVAYYYVCSTKTHSSMPISEFFAKTMKVRDGA